MRFTDNEYEFEKLNTKFDRDLDRLKDDYSRKAESLMYGDAAGLNMTKRRNRLWMWFDRKTRYKLLPKILIFAILACVSIDAVLMALMIKWDVNHIGSIELGAVSLLLNLIIPGMALCLQGVFANLSGHAGGSLEKDVWNRYPTVTDPAWHDLEENIYHHPDDTTSYESGDIYDR